MPTFHVLYRDKINLSDFSTRLQQNKMWKKWRALNTLWIHCRLESCSVCRLDKWVLYRGWSHVSSSSRSLPAADWALISSDSVLPSALCDLCCTGSCGVFLSAYGPSVLPERVPEELGESGAEEKRSWWYHWAERAFRCFFNWFSFFCLTHLQAGQQLLPSLPHLREERWRQQKNNWTAVRKRCRKIIHVEIFI